MVILVNGNTLVSHEVAETVYLPLGLVRVESNVESRGHEIVNVLVAIHLLVILIVMVRQNKVLVFNPIIYSKLPL